MLLRLKLPLLVSFITSTNSFSSKGRSKVLETYRGVNFKAMASREIEVEAKFKVSSLEELEKQISVMNGERMASKEFTDEYFDTDTPTLTLQNHWLRFRKYAGMEGSWQLKKPTNVASNDGTESIPVAIYEEIEGIQAVRIATSIITKRDVDDMEDEKSLLLLGGLKSFAKIITRRTRWTLLPMNGNAVIKNICIDIDVADFGHSVGEIEAVVDNEDKISEARNQIDAIMKEMGIESANPEDKAEGKLEMFLRTQRPNHFRLCIEAGVL